MRKVEVRGFATNVVDTYNRGNDKEGGKNYLEKLIDFLKKIFKGSVE